MANVSIFEQFTASEEYLSPIQLTILKTLEEHGPLVRRELVSKLKTARTTIYDNLKKLQKMKRVEKFSKNDGKRGRPVVYWKIT